MTIQESKLIKAKNKPQEQRQMHHQSIFSLEEELFLYAGILHMLPPTQHRSIYHNKDRIEESYAYCPKDT